MSARVTQSIHTAHLSHSVPLLMLYHNPSGRPVKYYVLTLFPLRLIIKKNFFQVYIRTTKNIIIEVNPKIRIPRTFDRFCGLMVQLLHKLSIHAVGGNREKLLKIVKNPVTRYFPPGSLKIGTSVSSDIVNLRELAVESQDIIVFVIGAMAHGSILSTSGDFLDRLISISHFPLSAAQTCSRICTAFEEAWHVEGEVSPRVSNDKKE
ncbi:unnamed protein product [Protopolystoma xenopodis]|uniref:Ribosomal RNA small subunit methyltransferase NEP1 n=1 Tax=Protopolystoma xenopodis TaxID=117903 RepID=A0A3S5A004_9PLAT|nr:unnamed protein product [Protopolystoma xenopodis]